MKHTKVCVHDYSQGFSKYPDPASLKVSVPPLWARRLHYQVLKGLESCLQHYNVCLRVYNPVRYPRRWGVAALEMGMALGAMSDLIEQVADNVV